MQRYEKNKKIVISRHKPQKLHFRLLQNDI